MMNNKSFLSERTIEFFEKGERPVFRKVVNKEQKNRKNRVYQTNKITLNLH